MDVQKILGENVKRYRKLKNLTQNEFSELVGISPNHLSKIEMGIRFASPEVIAKFAEVLDVSLASLFFVGGNDTFDSLSMKESIDEIITREMNRTIISIKQEIADKWKD